MPRHDFRCTYCSYVLRDQYRSIHVGGNAEPPICPGCRSTLMEWVIPVPRMDLRTDGEGKSGETFQKFTARDGRNQLVEIDSLHKLRQVERESEQLARNGEGQHITFRGFAQDRSNLLTNTHGEAPAQGPSAEAKRKWGLRGATKAIDTASDGSDITYGPGVNDSNTSALKDVS